MFYAVLLQFQTCGNLRAFPLPSTRSSSILPSLSLPLKPILTLCHPLIYTKVAERWTRWTWRVKPILNFVLAFFSLAENSCYPKVAVSQMWLPTKSDFQPKGAPC